MPKGYPLDAMRISLCMIVCNESEHLAGALQSVAPLVGEIIVLDTGSSDGSQEIARSFGARVIEWEWVDDFAAARNAAIAEATGDFILILDADERIAERDHATILAVTKAEPFLAFRFRQINYTNNAALIDWRPCIGKSEESEGFSGYVEASQVRLFPNRLALSYSNAVHETIEPACAAAGVAVKDLYVSVHHYGRTRSKAHLLAKARLYLSLGIKKLEEGGNDPKGVFELGVQLLELKLHAEAKDVFERLLAIDPNHANAQNMLGVTYTWLGDLDLANAVLRSAVALKPEFADAWNNLGVAQLKRGETETARESLERAIAIDPENANALANLASAESKLGRVKASLAHLEQAIGLDSYSAGHRLRRVMILSETDRESDARAELRALAFGNCHFEPANVYHWCTLSTELGIETEYEGFAAAHLDVMPLDRKTAIMLVSHLEGNGRDALAEALLERIVSVHSDFGPALDSLGCHLARRGLHAEALPHFIKALEGNTRNPGYLRNIALCCEEMGAIEQALKFYGHLAACDPSSIEFVQERIRSNRQLANGASA